MIHGIPQEELLEKSDTGVSLKVHISAQSDYFDGHFPDFKLLPAVAQIDLLAHYVRKYFGTLLSTPDIKRFKFANKVLPGATVLFKISFNPESCKVNFELLDFTDGIEGQLYSSGTYTARMA